MIIIIFAALISGILCGQFVFTDTLNIWFMNMADYVLYALMVSVGISIGMNKRVFRRIGEYHIKVLIIPAGVIIGSLIGGAICTFFVGYTMGESISIAAGMGWYSLSGILLTGIAGAQVGTVAFLSSLARELLSFLSIPFLSRRLNYYVPIAAAGATSEDTTLPFLIKYTNEEIAVLAVFNGIICSAAVPFLINFFSKL